MASVDYSHQAGSAPEPFGQTGVLQYAGRLVAWAFLCVGLCAAAMTHRSLSFGDVFEWNGAGQTVRLISSNGQFSLMSMNNSRMRADGWAYRGAYGQRRVHQGPWQSSASETFGVETRSDLPFRDVNTGFWLRLKWPTIAVIFLFQPLMYFVTRIVRRRTAAV